MVKLEFEQNNDFPKQNKSLRNKIGRPKYPALLEQLKEHVSDLELAEQQYQHKDLFMLLTEN